MLRWRFPQEAFSHVASEVVESLRWWFLAVRVAARLPSALSLGEVATVWWGGLMSRCVGVEAVRGGSCQLQAVVSEPATAVDAVRTRTVRRRQRIRGAEVARPVRRRACVELDYGQGVLRRVGVELECGGSEC
jgi:hypothetical protein